MKVYLAGAIALALMACSKEAAPPPVKQLSLEKRDEKLCQANVTKNLINPETVQFFEFTRSKELDAAFSPDFLASVGWRDASQYRLRFKAASKVGLLTTSVNRCLVYKAKRAGEEKEYCGCIDT